MITLVPPRFDICHNQRISIKNHNRRTSDRHTLPASRRASKLRHERNSRLSNLPVFLFSRRSVSHSPFTLRGLSLRLSFLGFASQFCVHSLHSHRSLAIRCRCKNGTELLSPSNRHVLISSAVPVDPSPAISKPWLLWSVVQ